MPSRAQTAAAKAKAEKETTAPTVENGPEVVFVDDLPEKPKTTRTRWWDTITPVLDANPNRWVEVYEGKGEDEKKADRNALSRLVRSRNLVKEEGTPYELEKCGAKVYARRI